MSFSPGAGWTGDARAALVQTEISRRSFIRRSGVMVIGFSLAWRAEAWGDPFSQAVPPGFNGPGSDRLDSWIAIGADGSVTAYTGKCELGHGLYTAQTQLIAEELCVPLERVKLIQCETGVTPDQGTTSGAQSHPTNFNRNNLALAGATARQALLERASARLGLPVDQLEAREGQVRVKSDPSRRIGYGALVAGGTFSIALDRGARRKDPGEWTILGQPIPRIEIPAIATGRFEYVHNVRLPGMLHGQVVRPPAVGATLKGVDESSVSNLPGVVKVVVRKNFVGVVAEKPWQALQAAGKLKATWNPGAGLPGWDGFYDWLRSQQPRRDSCVVNSKDVDEKLRGAATILKATYHYPYQMHASLGTSCAVADVRDGKATVWSATQAVYPLRATVSQLLGMNPEDIRVLFRMGSGCYGLNGADTVSYDAALLSHAVGRPVRVQLTRKDEMAWENFGVAYVIDQRAGLDGGGTIIAWDHESWSPTLGGRPGSSNPGNVVTGFLAGFQPSPFVERTPAPDPRSFANGSNAAPSYVTGCVDGRCGGTGKIASQRVVAHAVRSPFWTGPLRSPNRLQNTFAHESFLDEIAASIKQDPVEYRLRHLSDPRLIEIVRAAAQAARWESRPSPRTGNRRNGVAAGRGIACVLYEGDNGYCAMVADVEVNQDMGSVGVKRLVIASDCGPISNPDGLRNQLEGGALHGLSRTLLEEVQWDGQRITSTNWMSYRPLFLSADVPKIETVLIDRRDAPATGAGETSITVVGAAIANAVFDATGARVREIPLTPPRIKAALERRG